MEIQLTTEQKQVLSQRMILSGEILQMTTQELERYIKQQEMENPLIELEEEKETVDSGSELRRKLEWLNAADEQNRVYYREEYEEFSGQESWNVSRDLEDSLAEFVLAQLVPYFTTERDEEVLYYLAYSLDSRGYLEESIEQVAKRFGLRETEAAHYLYLLQSVEPAGIGARSLQECLLLQLDRRPDTSSTARLIVMECLNLLGKNQIPRIASHLGVSIEEVLRETEMIRMLDPKPGSCFSDREHLRTILPDVTVIKFQDYFQVMINDSSCPQIHINSYYRSLLDEDTSEETKDYIRTKLNQADWVVHCIEQRNKTLSSVTKSIVEWQRSFFEKGPGNRVPMRLTDIADRLGIHESTVSRAVHEKYLQCSWGIFPMNYFFTRAVGAETEDNLTPERIKEEIRRIIAGEDKRKPLSDQKIADALTASGMGISRRTVAKYRQDMNLPGTGGRRDFQ